MRTLDDAAKGALTGAVRALEARSGAEVVISVRPASSHYLHIYLVAGIVAAIALHAFLLYSPWPFSIESLLLYPVLLGAIVSGACATVPSIGRCVLPRRVRTREVERAARVLFYDLGVHKTAGRTGMLVYLSLREREATVVPDVGVEAAVSRKAWRKATDALSDAARRDASTHELAALLEAGFGKLLERALPRAADDKNELADEVA